MVVHAFSADCAERLFVLLTANAIFRPQVLLSAVKRLTPADAASAPDILFAVRQLACNDEICKAYADGGIVGSVLSLVKVR